MTLIQRLRKALGLSNDPDSGSKFLQIRRAVKLISSEFIDFHKPFVSQKRKDIPRAVSACVAAMPE